MEFSKDFLDEEVRNGYIITKQMKEVWRIQLEMVNKLLEVCKRHKLNIWASSGTLLGCVRDKGFIPWDDDIDMVMMREDYNKLIEVGPKEFEHPYFLQSAHSEKVPYPRGHAQLRMDGTTMILPYDIHQRFHQGVFIDIFVFDAVPSDGEDLKSFLKEVEKVRMNIFSWYSILKVTKQPVQMVCDLYYKYSHNFYEEYMKYENVISRYPIAERSNLVKLCLFYSEDYVHKKKLSVDLYRETEYLPFENIMMPVPKGYHEILTTLYGDYMKPAQAPTCHGGFAAIDIHKSYEEYLPKLKKEERKNRWRKLLTPRKLLP